MKTLKLYCILGAIGFNLASPAVKAEVTCRALFGTESSGARADHSDKDFASALELLAPHLSSYQRDIISYGVDLTSARKVLNAYDLIRTRRLTKSPVPGANLFEQLLNVMEVKVKFSEEQLAKIPQHGPLVVASNHPFGILDGLVLMSLVLKVRPDVKFMANALLASLPELEYNILKVPFGNSAEDRATRRQTAEESLRFVKNGGALVVFPAGAVAQAKFGLGRAIDQPWKHGSSRIMMATDAALVSVNIPSQNSRWFQIMGQLLPPMRPVYLATEFVNKEGWTVPVYIADPVKENWNEKFNDSAAELTQFMRDRTENLRKSDQLK